MQDSKAKADSKIPFLGDIPWVGNLFKRQTRSATKTELLIFLTPHIIRAPDDLSEVTNAEREKSGATKGLTESELHRFLDQLPATEQDDAKSESKSGK